MDQNSKELQSNRIAIQSCKGLHYHQFEEDPRRILGEIRLGNARYYYKKASRNNNGLEYNENFPIKLEEYQEYLKQKKEKEELEKKEKGEKDSEEVQEKEESEEEVVEANEKGEKEAEKIEERYIEKRSINFIPFNRDSIVFEID